MCKENRKEEVNEVRMKMKNDNKKNKANKQTDEAKGLKMVETVTVR